MLHHEGKVGTHALLTQLLYIVYKREKERDKHRNGHRSNRKLMQEQQPHEKHRSQGETVIVAAGSLEGSSNLLTVAYSPHARSFRRKSSSQQPEFKKRN